MKKYYIIILVLSLLLYFIYGIPWLLNQPNTIVNIIGIATPIIILMIIIEKIISIGKEKTTRKDGLE